MATVLYIEDHKDSMKLVQRVVKAIGHQLLWADNGNDGLALAHSERPDLILLDLNLPDIHGYDIVNQLRTHPQLCTTPIIILTANALAGEAERGLAAGADFFLAKPVDIRELWQQMETCLRLEMQTAV